MEAPLSAVASTCTTNSTCYIIMLAQNKNFYDHFEGLCLGGGIATLSSEVLFLLVPVGSAGGLQQYFSQTCNSQFFSTGCSML